jgi:hypothetical protein
MGETMPDPINLNQFRKQKAKADKKREADRNAVKFGRTKAEKDLDKARASKASRTLDGHKAEE